MVWRMSPPPQQPTQPHKQHPSPPPLPIDWQSKYNTLELDYALLKRNHQSLLQTHQTLLTSHTTIRGSQALWEETLRVRDRDQQACEEVLQCESQRRERDWEVFERDVGEARLRCGKVEEAYRGLGVLFQRRLGEVESLKAALADAEKESERLRNSSGVLEYEQLLDEDLAAVNHAGLDINQADPTALHNQPETDRLETESTDVPVPLICRKLETERVAQEGNDAVGESPEIEETRNIQEQYRSVNSGLEDQSSDEEPLIAIIANANHAARTSPGKSHAASRDIPVHIGGTCAQVEGEDAGVDFAVTTGTSNLRPLSAGQDTSSSSETAVIAQRCNGSKDVSQAHNSKAIIAASDSSTATTSSANNNTINPSADSWPNFDRKIHKTIAGFLVGTFAFGSLASYCFISRAVSEAVLPVLYETVVWDGCQDMRSLGIHGDQEAHFSWPVGWKWTRYLFLPLSFQGVIEVIAREQPASLPRHASPLLALFPDLGFHLTWQSHTVDSVDGDDAPPEIIVDRTLNIHNVVDSTILHELLTTLPLRVGFLANRDARSITEGFFHVRWHKNARILNSVLVDPVVRYFSAQIPSLSLLVEFGRSSMENRTALKDVLKILLEFRGEWSIRVGEGSDGT